MSEEFPPAMGTPRHLRETEKRLIQLLLEKSDVLGQLIAQLDSLYVQEMSDGGMGSLYLVSPTKAREQRRFGRQIADLQFDDADGVTVIASLNIDREDDLLELDIWKTDFSPLIRLSPDPLDIKADLSQDDR